MSMTTSVLVAKDGTRQVYHVRRAPADKRRDAAIAGAVTHAWTHDDTPKLRASCAACVDGTLPKGVR